MNQFEMRQKAYQSSLNSRALQVLLYLIDRADREQTCFPAVPTIGRELHISISTVKRAMRDLVAYGYVKKESRFREGNRGQTSNLYRLFFPERQEREVGKEQEREDKGGSVFDNSAVVEEQKDCVEYMERHEDIADGKDAAGREKSNVGNSGKEHSDMENMEEKSANAENDWGEKNRTTALGAGVVRIQQDKSDENEIGLVRRWECFKKRMFRRSIVCQGYGVPSFCWGKWLRWKCAYFNGSLKLCMIGDLKRMWTGEGVRMIPP